MLLLFLKCWDHTHVPPGLSTHKINHGFTWVSLVFGRKGDSNSASLGLRSGANGTLYSRLLGCNKNSLSLLFHGCPCMWIIRDWLGLLCFVLFLLIQFSPLSKDVKMSFSPSKPFSLCILLKYSDTFLPGQQNHGVLLGRTSPRKLEYLHPSQTSFFLALLSLAGQDQSYIQRSPSFST